QMLIFLLGASFQDVQSHEKQDDSVTIKKHEKVRERWNISHPDSTFINSEEAEDIRRIRRALHLFLLIISRQMCQFRS
ncbi:hypothetical protein PENTCL1PPCAC_21423, partial [Pristionchus entomophagus]